MFEHSTLQEAYTGSLIAGKGKTLNNIKVIMDRTRIKQEDWARVRFGAGTPWRRCWCVISPPDEKEMQKQQKSLKKKSAYDRPAPSLKGDIKFYDTKKIKKAQPIATIRDAYSAYAIYPQSKPLIDQSTLIKIEGTISIHSTPEVTTEGFVFVMPETHAAVTGFEMMLRYLFPVYDIFALYGRPNRLIADTLDARGLMFALPQERRLGYLEIFDVVTLIHADGSQSWNEQEWRKRLRDLTAQRITRMQASASRRSSRVGTRRGHRNSLPSRAGTLRFEDGASIRSSASLHKDLNSPIPRRQTGSAGPGAGPFNAPRPPLTHQRSVSDTTTFATPPRATTFPEKSSYTPSRLSHEASRPELSGDIVPPPPPAHGVPVNAGYRNPQLQRYADQLENPSNRSSSESERRSAHQVEDEAQEIQEVLTPGPPPAPVAAPPAFSHQPGAKPQTRPYHSPELRRANSRMSSTTLSQLAAAGSGAVVGGVAAAGAAAAWKGSSQQRDRGQSEEVGQRGVNDDASKRGMYADQTSAYEGMVSASTKRLSSSDQRSPMFSQGSNTMPRYVNYSGNETSPQGYLSAPYSAARSVSPLSQSSTLSQSQTAQELPGNSLDESFPGYAEGSDQHRPASQSFNDLSTKPLPIAMESQRPKELDRMNTSRSITRKPVPLSTSPKKEPEPIDSPSRSSIGSLREHAFDEAAYDQILGQGSTRDSIDDAAVRPRMSMSDSIDDSDSNVSPDYASTRKSTETRRSVEKPRAGVLKTVGTMEPVQNEVAIGDVRYRPEPSDPRITTEIPEVNFGPTHVMRPGPSGQTPTSGTGLQDLHQRSSSSDRFTAGPQNGWPSGNQRDSLVETNSPDRSGRNPVSEPNYRRSPSANSNHGNRRSVAWQPGAAIGSGQPGSRQSITAEEFVQQRAAAGRVTPVYSHQQRKSSTPPLNPRTPSGEWSMQHHGRQGSFGVEQPPRPQSRGGVSALNLSGEYLPPRPQSRGASSALNVSGDYSTHLSAREQEHVARVTGSPLINMAGNPNKQPPPGVGLVGAIQAREQEKKEIKEGLGGQMVQHAIAQRQQQARGYSYGQQQALPGPSPQMHIPGQYPQTPMQYAPMQGRPVQQQQQWTHPAAQAYWSTPQATPSYQQQPFDQYQQHPSQQGEFQQGRYQQTPPPQGQSQYNPYFGNGQGPR